MKLIESKAEYIPQEEGLEGIYKQIELSGRTAYHSQDKITPTSAKDFVDRMIKSKHGACLEHGTVYLAIPITTHYSGDANIYINSPYCKVNKSEGFKFKDIYGDAVDCWCITTNLRFIQENALWDDVKELLCSPTEFHEKRYTMRFITDIGVCRELLRHRVFSFLNESTRYCNYSKNKFKGEIAFITPSWYHDNPNEAWEDMKNTCFREICEQTEAAYLNSIKNGATPQEARQVLPLATKTELIMTGFSSDWRHVMDLRLFGKTGAPHPDMVDLMEKLRYEALEAGIWHDIMSKPSKFKE